MSLRYMRPSGVQTDYSTTLVTAALKRGRLGAGVEIVKNNTIQKGINNHYKKTNKPE